MTPAQGRFGPSAAGTSHRTIARASFGPAARPPSRILRGWIGVVLLAGLGGCSRPQEAKRAELELPAGARNLWIEQPEEEFRDPGWKWLTPPVRLPSGRKDMDQMVVAVRVPDGAPLQVAAPRDNASDAMTGVSLIFPPGSRLERLEWLGHGDARYLADVRGARIDDDGSVWHHNLRAVAPEYGAPLVGVEWREGDEDTRTAAMEVLIADLSQREPWRSRDEAARNASFDSLRKKSECSSCHQHDRSSSDRRGEHGLVVRGTDSHGFFTPRTVWADEIPLESYGAFDRNVGELARWLIVRCGSPERRPTRKAAKISGGRYRCADQLVPWAQLRLAAANRASIPHAQALCETRAWLYERSDPRARATLEEKLADCR